MNRFGSDLLARAGLAGEQHRHVRRCGALELSEDRSHRARATDERSEAAVLREGELDVFVAEGELQLAPAQGDAVALFEVRLDHRDALDPQPVAALEVANLRPAFDDLNFEVKARHRAV